jgi:ATP-dependent RNA helicase RhlE
LVSTDVSSRGIDVPETEVVINLTVPRDPLDYVHRIGRTGRAHRTGRAVTLVDPGERYAWERIEAQVGSRPERLGLPEGLSEVETSPGERKDQARAIDFERRRLDPTYAGAFHEKKRKPGGSSATRRRR